MAGIGRELLERGEWAAEITVGGEVTIKPGWITEALPHGWRLQFPGPEGRPRRAHRG